MVIGAISRNYSYQPQPLSVTTNPSEQKKKYINKTSLITSGLVGLGVLGIVTVNMRKPKKVDSQPDTAKTYIHTFEGLMSELKDAKINHPCHILANCVKENKLGSGAHSEVFKFADPKLENWVIKINHDYDNAYFPQSATIQRVKDVFPYMNMGQPVANITPRVEILKRIQGEPHSIQDWAKSRKEKRPISVEQTKKFVDDVQNISTFPQETFDDYAYQLKLYDEKGYKVDSTNPNNIMVDYKKKKLQIIDSYICPEDAHKNTKYDLIVALIDFPNLAEYYKKMSPMQFNAFKQSAKIIADKCTIASQKHGVSQSKNTYLNFLNIINVRGRRHPGNYVNAFRDAQKSIENL